MKIALRSPNWIGDCVMVLPAVYALKRIFPESQIFIITKEYLKDFFKDIKEIEKVITISDKHSLKEIKKNSKKINDVGFEIGILFTNSFISALLFKFAGIKNIYGYSKDMRGFLLDKKIKIPENEKHHRFFYLDMVNKLFNKNYIDIKINLLKFSTTEKRDVKKKLSETGLDLNKKIIGLSTTAAYGNAKVWPSEMFIKLILKLNREDPDIQYVLFGSDKEILTISMIANEIKKNCFNVAGMLSLRETMVGISLCNIFISNDSGLMHLADSLNIPLISIFGPTIPNKTKPVNDNSEILFNKASCSPCKHRECPTDHRCMTSIKVEDVYDSIVRKLI